MVGAAVNDDNIHSVALVAPWLHDREIVDAVYGGTESVESLIKLGREAEEPLTQNGTPTVLPAASTTDETAIMYQAPVLHRDRSWFDPRV